MQRRARHDVRYQSTWTAGARGRQVLDELFRGFTDALVAQGALSGDIGAVVVVDAGGRRFARASVGIVGLTACRPSIDAELRRRVRALFRLHRRAGRTTWPDRARQHVLTRHGR